MWVPVSARRQCAVWLACVFLACGGDDEPPARPPDPVRADACANKCTEVELCARENDGQHTCRQICASGLRCWSGCCLPLANTRYNVCRPAHECFPE